MSAINGHKRGTGESRRVNESFTVKSIGNLPSKTRASQQLQINEQDPSSLSGQQVSFQPLSPGGAGETMPDNQICSLYIKSEPIFDDGDLSESFWNNYPVKYQNDSCQDDGEISPDVNVTVVAPGGSVEQLTSSESVSYDCDPSVLIVDCKTGESDEDYIIKVQLEDPVPMAAKNDKEAQTPKKRPKARERKKGRSKCKRKKKDEEEDYTQECSVNHVTNNGHMVTTGDVTVCHVARPDWIPDLHCNVNCQCQTYERFRRKPRRRSQRCSQKVPSTAATIDPRGTSSEDIVEKSPKQQKKTGLSKKGSGSSLYKRKGPKPKRRRIREFICPTEDSNRPMACILCKRTFTCLRTCEDHIRIIHKIYNTGDKIFSCAHCDKEFTKQGLLDKHMTLHTGEKPYTCAICGQKLSQKVHLKRHLLVHSEKQLKCEECGKTFRLVQHLRRHISGHRGTLPFKCHLCHRAFGDNSGLKLHLNSHINRPHSCMECKAMFKSLERLAVHVKFRHSSG